MGNVCGSGDAQQEQMRNRSREIDKQLMRDGRHQQQEIKLLLLGAGESGKSTIFKQMKIIQIGGGFTPAELASYKSVIFGNCVTQMKVLVNAGRKMDMRPQYENNLPVAEELARLPSTGESFTPEVARWIAGLWADPGIQRIFELKDKRYQLNDSASYMFENVGRFAQPDYNPTVPDVLRVRIRSTGIEEAHFRFEDIEFRMLDVGGQRSERRKWMHCFDTVTAVIFCVALSEYDQMLREDETQNRMKESLLLFDEICNSAWFKETSFVVFFNKTDLFREKITRVNLNCCFSDFHGPMDFTTTSEFIKNKFLEQNKSPHIIYTHFTCAISTENVQMIFQSVRETLLKSTLSQFF